jgi:D-glycero-D-manno-heptose 1,7-bisphosphate phosphatase
MKKKAAFLDRDGVINKDFGYVHKWSEFEFVDGIFDLLKLLERHEYLLIVITNQSGIARGYYDVKTVEKLHDKMTHVLSSHGIHLDEIYYCPHLPSGDLVEYAVECSCRKPMPGMILTAAREHNIDLSKSILIGDKITDIVAGQKAGLKENFLISDLERTLPGEKYVNLRELSEVLSARQYKQSI